MPVYTLEYVILGNFLLSFTTLTFAAKTLDLKVNLLKHLLFSTLGAIMAWIYLVWPYFWVKILAIFLYFALIYLFTQSIAITLKLSLLILSCYFMLDGIYQALISRGYHPVILLLLGLIFSFLGTYVKRQYQKIRRLKKYGFFLEISYAGKKVTLKSYLDTGNQLYDPLSGWPVIIVEYRAVKKILPQDFFASNRARKIPFRAVGKERGYLWGFIPDWLKIWQEREVWLVKKAVVAVTFQSLNSDYMALLSEELLKSA
ncbi:sigma-E processing peptidase SpoIIGA [Carboxydothermus pertinax]|uniref:Sigma-E processing peptidase SpoIIGA n=1 Tax=Carboxydothermus pertinax TaxID=870242 RepID=A0A1L8CSC1_9THEO|nr:sigma-E processing peptidase SpoIIGA [Carboxydothermus pertinax]GAV21787.1 sigma-E processing peptidase SpoIIGA [Carboxydothermus pertinax]